MTNTPPTRLVESTDFRNAYAEMIGICMREGMEIVANEDSPSPVMTKDVHGIIVLDEHAIKQIIRKQIHPQFPTKEKFLEEYIRTFTREYLWEWMNQDPGKRFKYIYVDRLMQWKGINQLKKLKKRLEEKGINRQNQVITWEPDADMVLDDPPCLQRIWIRILDPRTTQGQRRVEIHLNWRSRDLYGAWMSNLVGLILMIIREVLGEGFRIVKLVDESDSLHIYESDWEAARKVQVLPGGM